MLAGAGFTIRSNNMLCSDFGIQVNKLRVECSLSVQINAIHKRGAVRMQDIECECPQTIDIHISHV